MTVYRQTEEDILKILSSSDCMPVAKLPIREMVTKAVPGKKYKCTDTGKEMVAEDGSALITRRYSDGTEDTYMNKKGPNYEFEDGRTWEDLKPGESAFGKLKGGPEYDRFAVVALPVDTVVPVWGGQPQEVLRPEAYVTVIYASKKFDMSEEGKWDSKQIVLNNNAGDIHPIDIKRKDQNGNPVVIGVLPLTAGFDEREKEFQAYIEKYYSGIVPEHLAAVMNNIARGRLIAKKLETRKHTPKKPECRSVNPVQQQQPSRSK